LAEPLAELAKLARDKPSLQESCKSLESILIALFAEPVTEAPPEIAADSAREKWNAAVPLLHEVPLSLDAIAFRRRWLSVCAAMPGEDVAILSKATLDPIALLNAVLSGRHESVATQAQSLSVNPEQLATVLRLSALPVLAHFAETLAGLRTGLAWDYGYCPTCGSWPLLAEVRGLEQLRILRCGLCATAWNGSRFRCFYCVVEDHRSLGYFHVEGEEDRYRAATCDECRGYVKVISTLAPLSPSQLLIADLATLHLDLAAANRGFSSAARGRA
jgi:FdhE protein